jgi:hypothetical protein
VLPRERAEQEQAWRDLIRREIGALGRLGKFMVILGLEFGENKGSRVRVVYNSRYRIKHVAGTSHFEMNKRKVR